MPLDFNAGEIAIAAVGVIGSWAVLRSTVADLKKDVAEFKNMLVTLTTVRTEVEVLKGEITRLRDNHEDLARRTSHLEGEQS